MKPPIDRSAFDRFADSFFEYADKTWTTGDESAHEREAARDRLRLWALEHGSLLLGDGAQRTVFAVPGGAIKLPWGRRDREGFAANRLEATLWAHAPKRIRRLLLPVIAADPRGKWVLMPRTKISRRGRMTTRDERLLRDFGIADFWGGEPGLKSHNVTDSGRVFDYGSVYSNTPWRDLSR